MGSKPTDKNTDYLVFISVMAAIAVLILHTNGCFWWFDPAATYWKSANIIECIFYFPVPMFFMSSGITLMDFFDRYSLKEYFIRRARKTVIPFLAWSLIGVVEKILIGQLSLESVNVRFLYQGITGTSIVSFYWFFSQLFILYLSLPLFAAVRKDKRKIVFTYLVIVGFILNILIPFIKTVTGSDLNTPYTVTVVSGVLIWVPLGWLLHNCKIEKVYKAYVYLLGVLGLLLHIIGTYEVSMQAGEVVGTYKGYMNVPGLLYSVAMFVLMKDIGTHIMKRTTADYFRWIGNYTLPIYLMQFILLDLVAVRTNIDQTSILYRLGGPFIFIPIIILATWCLRKIPVIREIVP